MIEVLTRRMASVIGSLEDELSNLEESTEEKMEAGQCDSLVKRGLEIIRLRRFLVP